MKSEGMKKFLHELVLYFWIPLIIALVSYIFFSLNDVTLGLIVLVASCAVYAIARLYALYKKWWLLVLLVVVILGSVGVYFLRAPAATLTINDQKITGTSITLPEGTITVIPAPQSNGEYTKDTVVTLSAEPDENHDWIGWTGTANDNVNPTTVTMNGDKDVKVLFDVRYSLIINNQQVIGSVVSFTEGSVTVNPPPSSVDGKYSHGTKITLTVRTNAGYDWESWTGTDNDNVNPTTVTMNSGKQITLAFSGRFELIINGQAATGNSLIFPEGTVTLQPAPGSDGKYASGSTVTLTANPGPGYSFLGWSGTNDNISNPTTVTINSEKHITLNWEQRFSVTINNQSMLESSITLTGGTVYADPPPDANGTYARNTKVIFTVLPAEGYRFGWWGGVISGTTNPTAVIFNSDKNITVFFVKTYNLTAKANLDQGGTITGGGTYDEGTSVTLTATPAAGYRFDRWEGDVSSHATSVKVTMNTNISVTAVFTKTYILSVTTSPFASGSVFPGGGIYDAGSNLTLTAAPVSGYRFDHWEGAITSNSTSVSIIMDADKSITAVFVKTFTLTVTSSPAEGGSASPMDGVYDIGSNVTITTTAAAGYIFDHWEGAVTGTDATITITMDSNKEIRAVFVPSP
jgi:hypothetical protein